MNAQVIFLNKWLDCPLEKRREHDLIQVLIMEEKAKFDYETRNYTPFQRVISKQKSHNLLRHRIKIIAKDGEIISHDENYL